LFLIHSSIHTHNKEGMAQTWKKPCHGHPWNARQGVTSSSLSPANHVAGLPHETETSRSAANMHLQPLDEPNSSRRKRPKLHCQLQSVSMHEASSIVQRNSLLPQQVFVV
jgi:hypothetical protein